MSNPEFSENRIIPPHVLAEKRMRARPPRQIFPPQKPPEVKEQTESAVERLRTIKWPNPIDTKEREIVVAMLASMGEELMHILSAPNPRSPLTFGATRFESVLKNIKRGLPEHERDEVWGASEDATTAIWYNTDPQRLPYIRHKFYKREPERLPEALQQLLSTSQKFLEWETVAKRHGLDGQPNMWGKLIDMYNAGMHSYEIRDNSLLLSMQVKKSNGTTNSTFLVLPNPQRFD